MIRKPNRPTLFQRIGNTFQVYGKQILLLIGLVIVLSLLFPRGKSLQYSYQLNDITREPILAPFNFPVLKTDSELQSDLNEALKSEPFIFVRSQSIVTGQIATIERFFTLLKEIRAANVKLSESRDFQYRNRFSERFDEARTMLQTDSATVAVLMAALGEEFPFAVGSEKWNQILVAPPEQLIIPDLDKFKDDIIQICRNHWTEGIYDIALKDIISEEVAVKLGEDQASELTAPDTYIDLQQAWTKARVEVTGLYKDEQDLRRDLGYELIVEFMKPNLIYDRETTERRQQAVLDRVPRNKGIVIKNERIVDANMRITEDVLQKLNSLTVAIDRREKVERGQEVFLAYIGRVLLITVIVSFFFTFLLTYRTPIFNDWKMVLLLDLVFITEIGLAYLFYSRLNLSEYLIPVTVAAMVLTIIFDARIGFMGITSIVLLVTILIGNNVEFMVTALFTSSAGIYAVRRLRTRSQLFTAIFALIASSIIVVLGQGLFKGHNWSVMGDDLLYLSVISVLSPIVTYGLIGILEVSFGATTNLTLIELLDFQHPLLKRLQQEANGTFNHSVVVGNLAEACADAIGANALLCRVGAYYHDVGKMVRPEYFIENQYSGVNKHDSLTPIMSAKIIKNHVSEGMNLAREYGLPTIVSDFIPMHHGTTRVEYFYRKALKNENGENIDEQSYKYPGPKPNTRETGILMICEAIEAAVRSIKEPEITRIEEMINRIINKRVSEGQLNECPLTLDELTRIKGKVDGTTGLLPVLRGIYHIRIEYPEAEEKPNSGKTKFPKT
ncbi:MAG: HD family phosphohydrolase [Fidelibacterota bacterium]